MKMKTNKGVLKRVKITGKKKVLRRPINQGHFNAKDSGSKTQSKRKAENIPFKNISGLKKQIPYNL